jgi:hypothetical protein
MVGRGNILLDTQYLAELACEFGRESGISVANDARGETKPQKDVAYVQGSGFFCGDFFYAWNEYRCFTTVVIRDRED